MEEDVCLLAMDRDIGGAAGLDRIGRSGYVLVVTILGVGLRGIGLHGLMIMISLDPCNVSRRRLTAALPRLALGTDSYDMC